MTKVNEIAIARKAVRKALASGEICKEISGMHRVAMDAIKGICKNEKIAHGLAYYAATDVLLGR